MLLVVVIIFIIDYCCSCYCYYYCYSDWIWLLWFWWWLLWLLWKLLSYLISKSMWLHWGYKMGYFTHGRLTSIWLAHRRADGAVIPEGQWCFVGVKKRENGLQGVMTGAPPVINWWNKPMNTIDISWYSISPTKTIVKLELCEPQLSVLV